MSNKELREELQREAERSLKAFFAKHAIELTQDHFKRIVLSEVSVACQQNTGRLAAILRMKLTAFSPEDVAGFDRILISYLDSSFTDDLYLAYYIVTHNPNFDRLFPNIVGYVSTDGFIYFRAWLIAQGQVDFKRVLQDVENLADDLAYSIETSGEPLLYVAGDVYESKTGEELIPSAGGYNNDGVQWSEGTPGNRHADLRTRFPKLYHKHIIRRSS